MADTDWTISEDDWETLLYTIKEGDCILLLGPEIPSEEVDGMRRSLAEIMAHRLADELRDETEIVDRNSLTHVSQQYCTEKGQVKLWVKCKSFYENGAFQPSQVHTALAALPFSLIINTTHDSLMVQALNAEKECLVEVYDFRGGKEYIVQTGSPEKPLVYYLYGSTDQPKSLVLSESDLLDFLVAIISKTPPLPANITSEFQDKYKSFLFLGFGFRNWYLRILMRVLRADNKDSQGQTLAFEQLAAADDANFQRAKIFFKNEYQLQFCSMDLTEFATELKRRYGAQGTGASSEVSSEGRLPINAPEVFICHASEDKDEARNLSDQLKQRGLKPWLDKDQIYGGDSWDALIAKTLDSVDYVVVLQSKALEEKRKGRSYVNKEIKLAIENEGYFATDTRFIMPVQIEDCEMVEQLKHRQTIDLRMPEAIDALASAMKRDFQRRGRA